MLLLLLRVCPPIHHILTYNAPSLRQNKWINKNYVTYLEGLVPPVLLMKTWLSHMTVTQYWAQMRVQLSCKHPMQVCCFIDRHQTQQLNKSFIRNVPLLHHSSFRCKRSNNFLNKRQKKNIYKIPIQLIINGLSKAPLCIWTTAAPVGKGHTAIIIWKIKLRKHVFL